MDNINSGNYQDPSAAKLNMPQAVLSLAKSLENDWRMLCHRFLPIEVKDSIWRYSRHFNASDPEQGWKLHVSATILTANKVLETIAPLLTKQGTLFKAPDSLQELQKINSGLYYGYEQIGKFITVYPQTDEEAVGLAGQLDLLVGKMPAPVVSFDFKFKPGSCIYYRYGAFKPLTVINSAGTTTLAIRDQSGNLIPDLRCSAALAPEWLKNPFPQTERKQEAPENLLKTTIRVFRALEQRGKGGVYQAVDFSVAPPRLCVLKEGRLNGEVEWNGRDGFWRVRHEKCVLEFLQSAEIPVPRVYNSFEAEGRYYFVTEFIEGENLHAHLRKRKRRISIFRAIDYGIQLAALLAQIHRSGWAWRDCKPGNIILTKEKKLRPLDFEGACAITQPDPSPWGTAPFISPGSQNRQYWGKSKLPDDLFAMGMILYLLFEGRLPDLSGSSVKMQRRRIPLEIRQIISKLLDVDPLKRPDAQIVVQTLLAVGRI